MFRLAKASLVLSVVTLFACAVAVAGDKGETIVTEYNPPQRHAAGYYGIGADASPEEIAGWDIDVRPDGLGLPEGGATAEDGEMLYEDLCASCHGSFGEGVGRYPVLAGGEGTLTESRPEKTVGSFWPYASTLWDYINRAMPFTAPESLSDEEVYAITAYVLYLNDLVDYEFELTQANLASVEMPNKDGFYFDDRPDVANERCMENCKDPASIKITSEPEPAADDPGEEASGVARAAVTSAGELTYQQACAVCHAAGIGEAPIPGDKVAWSGRLAKGRAALVASALSGIGIMPPKGGRSDISDDDIAAAVDFIIAQSAR
jgi:S-disulfanyl-L-cysteine oxidoreductase SoxD